MANSIVEYVVIGSGPAGWATLEALVAKGKRPTLIDIGNDGSQVELSTILSKEDAPSFSLKSRHGATYMYEYPEKYVDSGNLRMKIPLSGAFGGLSTVWGTNLQLCREACISDGDHSEIEYLNATKTVLSQIFHSGAPDDLDVVGKWPIPFSDKTPQSERMQKIQAVLIKKFAKTPFKAGMARNATHGSSTGCVLCGKCMTGCNYDSIFSTEKRIRQLIDSKKILFVRGAVERMERKDDFLNIFCCDNDHQTTFNVVAHTVFLAAGSIASAGILMRSEIIPPKASLRETQVAYLPIFVPKHRSDQATEYSLAQVFVESANGLSNDQSFHMSLYEPSDDWSDRIQSIHPKLGKLLSRVMLKYLIAGICFLPAAASGKLWLNLSNEQTVNVSQSRPANTPKIFRVRLRRLRRLVFRSGIIPLVEFAEFPSVGSSFHVGVLEVNEQMCIKDDGTTQFGLGLYVVDGSALRTLPAGPVTLSVMVNATMIANRVVSLR